MSDMPRTFACAHTNTVGETARRANHVLMVVAALDLA
jgi:hypothetical protein